MVKMGVTPANNVASWGRCIVGSPFLFRSITRQGRGRAAETGRVYRTISHRIYCILTLRGVLSPIGYDNIFQHPICRLVQLTDPMDLPCCPGCTQPFNTLECNPIHIAYLESAERLTVWWPKSKLFRCCNLLKVSFIQLQKPTVPLPKPALESSISFHSRLQAKQDPPISMRFSLFLLAPAVMALADMSLPTGGGLDSLEARDVEVEARNILEPRACKDTGCKCDTTRHRSPQGQFCGTCKCKSAFAFPPLGRKLEMGSLT